MASGFTYEQLPGNHKRLFISQKNALTCTGSRQGRQQTCRANDCRHDIIHLRQRRNHLKVFNTGQYLHARPKCTQTTFKLTRSHSIGHHGKFRFKFKALLLQRSNISIRTQRNDLILIRVTPDDIQGAHSYRPSRPQYRQTDHDKAPER